MILVALERLDESIRMLENLKGGNIDAARLALWIFAERNHATRIFGGGSPEATQLSSAVSVLSSLTKEPQATIDSQPYLPSVQSVINVLRACQARLEGCAPKEVVKQLGLIAALFSASAATAHDPPSKPLLPARQPPARHSDN